MSVNIISEHWKRADQTIEVVELKGGESISVHIKDGEAIIFPSLWSFAQYEFGKADSERIYCSEEDLQNIYDLYDSFYKIPAQGDDKWDKAKNYKNISS